MTNDRVRLDAGPHGRILDTAIMRVKRRWLVSAAAKERCAGGQAARVLLSPRLSMLRKSSQLDRFPVACRAKAQVVAKIAPKNGTVRSEPSRKET